MVFEVHILKKMFRLMNYREFVFGFNPIEYKNLTMRIARIWDSFSGWFSFEDLVKISYCPSRAKNSTIVSIQFSMQID